MNDVQLPCPPIAKTTSRHLDMMWLTLLSSSWVTRGKSTGKRELERSGYSSTTSFCAEILLHVGARKLLLCFCYTQPYSFFTKLPHEEAFRECVRSIRYVFCCWFAFNTMNQLCTRVEISFLQRWTAVAPTTSFVPFLHPATLIIRGNLVESPIIPVTARRDALRHGVGRGFVTHNRRPTLLGLGSRLLEFPRSKADVNK